MKIFVTGGTGSVGPAVVRSFLDLGHELLIVGRREKADVGQASYERCPLGDYDRLRSLMAGSDAVVHLAAHASPIRKAGRDVMASNALGTWHVYEAAAANGIGRVVSASSINALGYFYGKVSFPIEYLPVDEEHPTMATDAYSFSKQCTEHIAEYFYHREGITGTCLRLPGVWVEGQTDFAARRRAYAEQKRYVQKLLELPESELIRELERLHAGFDRMRRDGYLEDDWRADKYGGRMKLSAEEVSFMTGKANFWANLDERDSAQAVVKSTIAAYEGCHTLFVNYSRNSIGLPPADLARLFLPNRPEVRGGSNGDTCLVSIRRARKLIGFEPEHPV